MNEPQTNANEPQTIPKMVTVKEAAKLTGMTEYFIRSKLRNNEIVYVKTGTKYLINFNLFVDFLNGKQP